MVPARDATRRDFQRDALACLPLGSVSSSELRMVPARDATRRDFQRDALACLPANRFLDAAALGERAGHPFMDAADGLIDALLVVDHFRVAADQHALQRILCLAPIGC